MKSIAIVGTGPAGLVAAKTLLHSYPLGTFRVLVYKQSPCVGGLWASDSTVRNSLIDPEMQTNLTQFTVSFSDLSWESVNVSAQPHVDHSKGTTTSAAYAPIYPKAWHVNRYLQQYSQRFIPADIISFNTRVIRAERVDQDGLVHWKITSINRCSKEAVEVKSIFDYMIATSGFLERPREIDCKILNFVPSQRPIQVLHSSLFRSLSDLSISGEGLKRGKVLIVGGSHSGDDTAASIAFQMSTSRYSPLSEGAEPVEIIHIMPQPMYAIPPFIPAGTETRAFIPLDFLLYQTVSRPPGPISVRMIYVFYVVCWPLVATRTVEFSPEQYLE